jgi:signal transduction histidine kinase
MAIPPLRTSSDVNKSEILYGVENAVGRGVYFMSNVKQKMDIFFDHRAPSIVVDVEEYRKGYIAIRKRGGKIRAFTEITKDNLRYCKELMKMVDELRHLDGVKGGVAVNESEYMATTVLQETKPLTQVIYSNVKEVVEQGQYIFDTLWNAAIPAEKRIREIEEGIVKYETRVLQDQENIINEIIRLNEHSNELSICATAGGIQFTYDKLFEVTGKLLDRFRKGQHKGIRYITYIDKDSVKICEVLLHSGVQIKHIKNLPPMSFGVSDKELGATIEKLEHGKAVQSLLISNEPMYVKHFDSIFEDLWKKGVDAKSRIQDIEEGVETPAIDVIQDPHEIQELGFKLINSATNEIRIIFSTANAFRRQEHVGVIQSLEEASAQTGIKVRILTPKDKSIEEKVQELRSQQQQQIDIRYIVPNLQTKASILVADDSYSLSVELKDDTKNTSYEAIGLATYSNSKPTVLSYISIFESLWNQTKLYEQLIQAHEQLKAHDKMQREFINVAAHELRTPIQPILGLSAVLRSRISKDRDAYDLIDVIERNAKRLQRLTEDILDVTRIGSQSLKLNKEKVNINEKIQNVINDVKSQIQNPDKLKIVYSEPLHAIYVQADKSRLYQVIANLLINAIKFTKEGTISISAEVKDNKELIFTVKDTGEGIHPDILPRLFTKFATRSNVGTGLGLYISKSIVDAHGGRMWAENNSDGKGAIFTFTLPLSIIC